MGYELPKNWVHKKEDFERAFKLGEVIHDPVFVNNIYLTINMLEFLGKNYSFWNLSDEEFTPVYCQNYLTTLGSLFEAIIQTAFKEKEERCTSHCSVYGKGNECPFYWGYDEHKGKVPGSELRFVDLIERARAMGFLKGLDSEEINNIRKIRNNIHMNRLHVKYQDADVLSEETINRYQIILKKLFLAVHDWLKENGDDCLYDASASSLKKKGIDSSALTSELEKAL